MLFKVVLEEGENGWIVAECPALPGCVSEGRTEEDALANIKEAIELWLETELDKRLRRRRRKAKVCEVVV